MGAVIETNELKKSYGKHEAVKGLNLAVQDGSVCAFLGQNGAGKSSTIKMLLGMIHPTSGTGSIFGHRIDNERESLLIRQQVAFVAEDKRLYDYMTVVEILRFTRSFFPNWNDDFERHLLDRFDFCATVGFANYRKACARSWPSCLDSRAAAGCSSSMSQQRGLIPSPSKTCFRSSSLLQPRARQFSFHLTRLQRWNRSPTTF